MSAPDLTAVLLYFVFSKNNIIFRAGMSENKNTITWYA